MGVNGGVIGGKKLLGELDRRLASHVLGLNQR